MCVDQRRSPEFLHVCAAGACRPGRGGLSLSSPAWRSFSLSPSPLSTAPRRRLRSGGPGEDDGWETGEEGGAAALVGNDEPVAPCVYSVTCCCLTGARRGGICRSLGV